jgi:hypothetical protein
MINKFFGIIIPVLLLLGTSYAPAHGISVKTAGESVLHENISDKVINHSSFAQIPGQVFDMCVKVSKALQTGMLMSFSNSVTVIRTFYEIININLLFGAVNLNKNKEFKISHVSADSFSYAGSPDKNAGSPMVFMLFGLLLMLLCLLAVKKANLPYAVFHI